MWGEKKSVMKLLRTRNLERGMPIGNLQPKVVTHCVKTFILKNN